MISMMFKALSSNVEHCFQFEDEQDRDIKLQEAVMDGTLLVCDYDVIQMYLEKDIHSVLVNHNLMFEVTEIDGEAIDSQSSIDADGS